MKKHVLTVLFLVIFTGFATAQLTLRQVENGHKKTLPIGALIEIKLPTKTSRPDCNCYEAYKGYFKKVEKDNIYLVLTNYTRETVDDNKAGLTEITTFQQPEDSSITRIPTAKILAINRYSESNAAFKNMGGILVTLATLSNLFLAPQLDADSGKKLRNGGYVVIGVGILTALLPTKKTFYFEQPKNKKKMLWQLSN